MTNSAKKWFLQEIEMVKNRVLLKYIPKLTFGCFTTRYTGNPMTIKEGIKHMRDVVYYIREHPDLYK